MTHADNLDHRLREFVVQNGDDLGFTRYFWKECEPLQYDLTQYRKFASTIRRVYQRVDSQTIAREFAASTATEKNWIRLTKMPKLGHFLKAFLRLRPPEERHCWLNVETTHGHAIPIGRLLKVPLRIEVWKDMDTVLAQLEPLQGTVSRLDKRYVFGFLLGMVIGDAAKSKQCRGHRHLGLVLSKRYDTNLALGDFTCECAQFLGLRMHRSNDQPRPKSKPHGFYEWMSQASSFIDWIFNVALGLQDGQVTTYDPIKADWVMDAPTEFRPGLLQGLAESDGSVNVPGQEVEFWIGPNYQFMQDLLATFGLRSFRSREAVSLSKREAVKAFYLPTFSPILQTVRYERLHKLAGGKRLSRGGERLPQEISGEIGQLSKNRTSITRIVETILERHG